MLWPLRRRMSALKKTISSHLLRSMRSVPRAPPSAHSGLEIDRKFAIFLGDPIPRSPPSLLRQSRHLASTCDDLVRPKLCVRGPGGSPSFPTSSSSSDLSSRPLGSRLSSPRVPAPPFSARLSREYKTFQRPEGGEQKPAPQPFRYLCILDFEATCDENKRHFWPQEVIEFPVVVVDTASLEVVGEFRHFCRPMVNPLLTPFCKTLTGITQEQVDAGTPFADVLPLLRDFLDATCPEPAPGGAADAPSPDGAPPRAPRPSPSSSDGVSDAAAAPSSPSPSFLFVTCGDWDLKKMLLTQAKLSQVEIPFYLKHWANVKDIAQLHYGRPAAHWAFRTLLRYLQLPMLGRHHSGIDDSRNIANAVVQMIKDGCTFVPTCDTWHASDKDASTRPAAEQVGADSAPELTWPASTSSPATRSRSGRSSLSLPKSSDVDVVVADDDAEVVRAEREIETRFEEIEDDMFDACARLTHPFVRQLDRAISNAHEARVRDILVVGMSSPVSNSKVLEICKDEKYERMGVRLGCSVGIHPYECDKMMRHKGLSDTLSDLESFISDNPAFIKAIGECGLNFEQHYSTRRNQEEFFAAQLDMAMRLNLPLLLHEKNAHRYFLPIYEPLSSKVKGVVHSFTGTRPELEKYIEMGCYIGINGSICDERKNRELVDVVAHLPLDRIIVESNTPMNLPRNIPKNLIPRAPLKNQNEPSLLPWVVHKIARIQRVSPQLVARTSSQNARSLFYGAELTA